MHTPPSSHPDPHGLPPEADAWLRDHPDVPADDLAEVWRLAAYAQAAEPAAEPDADRFAAMQERVLAALHTPAPSTPPDRVPAATVRTPALDRPARRRDDQPGFRRRARLPWTAALALVVCGLVAALWSRPVVVEVAVGDRQQVELPDGSRVELNSGSRLSYARWYGWRSRRVTLQGEGFFAVAHDAGTPFAVQTFNGMVTVLGTRFNVRARPDDEVPETAVVLEQGRVQFASQQAPEAPVLLAPGQMSRLRGRARTPSAPAPVEVVPLLNWRTGGVSFIDQPLGVILHEVERRFGTPVQVQPTSARSVSVSLILNHAASADDVLTPLARIHGYTVTKTGRGYVLTAPETAAP